MGRLEVERKGRTVDTSTGREDSRLVKGGAVKASPVITPEEKICRSEKKSSSLHRPESPKERARKGKRSFPEEHSTRPFASRTPRQKKRKQVVGNNEKGTSKDSQGKRRLGENFERYAKKASAEFLRKKKEQEERGGKVVQKKTLCHTPEKAEKKEVEEN